MHILKTITTISLALLLNISTANATTEDSTDVKHSIIQSLSQNHQDYLGYQSTIVEMYRNYSNNRFATNSPELHFLGGDYFNHDIVINGLSFRNPLTGRSNISLANSFFENIKIYSGNIPLQFSNVNSAVIELSSPYLSKGYDGSFEMLSDNFVGNKFDQNYYRGVFSGSLSKNNKLKFWTAFERKWLGDRLPSSYTTEVLTGNPDILPNNQLSGWTYHGKLQYKTSQNSLFSITTDATTDEWQEYLHYYNNPSQPNQIAHTPRYKDDTYGINVVFAQALSGTTDYSLSAGFFKSEYLKGDGVIFDDLASYPRDFYNPEFDNYSLFREGRIAPDNQFYEAYYSGYQHHISTYKQFRGEVNHTYNEIHQIKAGVLYKKYNLKYYNNQLATLPNNSMVPEVLYVSRYGFDADGNESDNESWRNSTKEPKELSLYISDKVFIDNITLNFGVRFDRYDYNALQLKNPNNPFDPDTTNAFDNNLDESDMKETEVYTSLNPQIGMDIKASDRMNIYFSWNQNHQVAPYGNMYLGWDYFEERVDAGFFSIFPSSTIEPIKSETIIIGLKSKLNAKLNLNANFSIVEYEKQLGGTEVTPTIPFSYNNFSNINTSSYFGVNLLLQYDNHKNFSGFVDVTKSKVEGLHTAFTNIGWGFGPTEDFPLDYDKEIKIVAGASYKTNFGVNLHLIAKQESGYLYTPTQVGDAVFGGVSFLPQNGPINSLKADKLRVVDLKLEKEFKISKNRITAFVFIKNLLDEEIITGVYSGTGSPTNTGFLDTSAGQDNILYNGDEYVDKYNFAQNNPLNFNPPRQIFFGLKASF